MLTNVLVVSSSSSSSSQDILLSPFLSSTKLAWGFYATFIHNIPRKVEDWKEARVPLSVQSQLLITTTITEQEEGEERREEAPQKLIHTLIHALSHLSL